MKPLTEHLDLSDFRYPMEPIPDRVERAIAAGVQIGRPLPFSEAPRLLEEGGDGATDGVFRQSDGTLVVACLTEMPGVTPDMWDWWFGWHGYTTERYKLWHPKEHVWSAMREDRRQLAADRDRWVGNVSYVDEYIGPKFHRLAIAFQPPSSFGFDEAKVDAVGTVICARTAVRRARLDGGYLAHFVRATSNGSEMLSRFWLGQINSQISGIRRPLNAILNTRPVRRRLIGDDDGLHTLRHCSDEMNHLARILPGLHKRFSANSP